MANCKACGRPATAALVIHQDCLHELLGQMCDHNCKWPVVCMDEERLEMHCRMCPIAKLLENGGVSS
ncbi:MAG: hypothetical protein J6K94_03975 [Ruminiclostridium sp.]|nr:hypothetical protein [Ruminiclostridium sp.]